MKFNKIVLLGPPGAGKTTIARSLGEFIHNQLNYKVYHIEVDRIREMEINHTNPEIETNCLWFELLITILQNVEMTMDVIIIDGLFYDENCVYYLIEHFDSIEVFNFECSLETCIKRNNARSKKLDRQEVKYLWHLDRSKIWHKVNAEQKIDTVLSYVMEAML